jgi:porphobilinogen synthase
MAQGRTPIASMPGIAQLSVDEAVREAEAAFSLGVPAVILFGIPAEKDPLGLENFAPMGSFSRRSGRLNGNIPEMVVVTDVCLCEYTDHGHCGVLNIAGTSLGLVPYLPDGYVLNDPTLDVLGKVAVSHAECGADIVAPSGMMDGMVAAIRDALDERGFENMPILSYAVKYASSFYGPFRDAAEGAPKFGDRKSTRWTRPTSARPCARPPWMWMKARTC